MAINCQGNAQTTPVAQTSTTLSAKDLIAKLLASRNLTTTVKATTTLTTAPYEAFSGLLNSVKSLLEKWLLSPPVVGCCGNCSSGTTAQSTTTVLPSNPAKTTTPPFKCGTLLSYPANDLIALGKFIGTYYDGNPIYAGSGYFPECYGQGISPARISVSDTLNGKGAYSPCSVGNGETYDTSAPKFFYNHPDLKWIKTNGSTYGSVEGAILVGYHNIGRINITMANMTFQGLGKIYDGYIYYTQPDMGIENSTSEEFEILACVPCPVLNPSGPCCLNGG